MSKQRDKKNNNVNCLTVNLSVNSISSKYLHFTCVWSVLLTGCWNRSRWFFNGVNVLLQAVHEIERHRPPLSSVRCYPKEKQTNKIIMISFLFFFFKRINIYLSMNVYHVLLNNWKNKVSLIMFYFLLFSLNSLNDLFLSRFFFYRMLWRKHHP